jgi:hypothetical protein
MMSAERPLAERIAQIHAERARNAASAQELATKLDAISTALSALEQVRLGLLPLVTDEKIRDPLLELEVPLNDLRAKTVREQAALGQALLRLRRSTLNIGIIGRARQGKSKFLQSLTGLTAREIPDGARQFCTGVPSMIQHVPGATYANVFFRSEASFLDDVIGPYYQKLSLGPVPFSAADFGAAPLPPLPSDADSTEQTEYEHLRAYHDKFGQYRELIGATSPRRIGPDEIRSYVAQDTEDGERRFNAFRAVKHVEIFTQFKRVGLAGVGVIDLPGLGDTNLGDSSTLLGALEDDVDIVLFLRRPHGDGDGLHDHDIELYGIARRALPEIPMERRSSFILNHVVSTDARLDNGAMCETFRTLITNSPAIRVVGSPAIADCSSPEEVEAAFSPVVDYLVTNIGELDRMLLAERNRQAAEIREEARLLINRAAAVRSLAQPASAMDDRFPLLFLETHGQLAFALEQLVLSYQDTRDQPNEALAKAVSEAITTASQHKDIPDEASIRVISARAGAPEIAYLRLLDELRTALSRHFLDLDAALSETIDALWTAVARVFKNAGQLAPLAQDPATEGIDYLREFAAGIPADSLYEELRKSLQTLIDFDLSYRGFIQHHIRPCLDGLQSSSPSIEFPAVGQAPRPDEKMVRQMLVTSYDEAVDRCTSVLQPLLKEPNQAVFAVIEEFRDRVLRSHLVDEAWRRIYDVNRVEIWPGEFAAFAENAKHLRAWNDALHRLGSAIGDSGAPGRLDQGAPTSYAGVN